MSIIIPLSANHGEANTNGPTKRRLKIMGLDELMNDNSQPPTPIIEDGVLHDKSLCLIYGPPKSHKTFLCMGLATAMAAGQDYGPFKIPKPRKVLHLSAEGGYSTPKKQLTTIATSFPQLQHPNLQVGLATQLDVSNEGDLQHLKSQIEYIGAEVLILDPLIRFHTLDENVAQEMNRVIGNLRRLIEECNISIILVHHSGKDVSQGPRGSSTLVGEYDSSIAVRKRGNLRELHFDMRSVETPASIVMRFNPKTYLLEMADLDPLVAILEKAGKPLSKSEFVKEILARGIVKAESGAYKRIDGAVRKWLVAIDHNGHYVPASEALSLRRPSEMEEDDE